MNTGRWRPFKAKVTKERSCFLLTAADLWLISAVAALIGFAWGWGLHS